MEVINTIYGYIVHPIHSLRKRALLKKLDGCIDCGGTEAILEILLELMSIVFILDRQFRKNIVGFKGKYLIKDRDGSVDVSFKFESDRMSWQKTEIQRPDIAVTFKDAQAVCAFLFSKNPDILDFVLNNRVNYAGNLNYLFKFAYMAKHLQLKLLG